MFFRESVDIARSNRDLEQVMVEVDKKLATIFSSSPLRARDFARAIGCDVNQVVSVFNILEDFDVLNADDMVECDRCYNLMSAAEYDEAVEDEELLDCTSCGRTLSHRLPRVRIFRMTRETLARPKPAVATPHINQLLRAISDEPFVFRRLGDAWILKYENVPLLMSHANGLCFIAHLISNPHRGISVIDLHLTVEPSIRHLSTGTIERSTDAETIRMFKARRNELVDEREEAKRLNDIGRQERIDSELTAIEAQFSKLLGLDDQPRKTSRFSRSRTNVSMAVSRAIESIHQQHSDFGNHLRGFISSGMVFCYSPDRKIDWLTSGS